MMKDKTAISFRQKAFGTNTHSFRTIFDTPLIPALFKQTPVDIAFQCIADSYGKPKWTKVGRDLYAIIELYIR